MAGSAQPSAALKVAMAQVGHEVDTMFDALLPRPDGSHGRLSEAMRYAAIGGGKRLRPLLLITTAQLHGVDRTSSVRAAVGIEAIHAYSLIHDDLPCMDDDAMRHGKPSVHAAFGQALAVLAGDALQSFAFEVLSDPATCGDPWVRADLVHALAVASGACGMAGGQAMDMAGADAANELQAITRLQQLKTGALIGAAVEMGAILGKLPPEGRTGLRGYARDIGLAFQIADDLLDEHGEEAAAGKALRKDKSAGKATFVSLLGSARAHEQAAMLVDQAISHLSAYGPEADILRDLARYTIERDR